MSDILIPYSIFRKSWFKSFNAGWVQDIPSLHFLRFFFLDNSNWNSLFTSMKWLSIFSKSKTLLFGSYIILIYLNMNFYFFLLVSYNLPFQSSAFLNERIERKIEHLQIVSHTVLMDPRMSEHALCSQGKGIKRDFFMKKWKSYCNIIWMKIWPFHINKFSNYSFYFLGFISSVKRNHLGWMEDFI